MKEDPKPILQCMFRIVTEMIDLVDQGFMENDIHVLDRVMDKERMIDDMEKDVTAGIVENCKGVDEEERKKLVILGQIAQNIERIGDELRSLVERIEIKITDKLYFSEEGMTQYKEVFETMRKSADLVMEFLKEDKVEVLDKVLKNGDQIKELVEKYRAEHIERLTKGVCEPRAANMYFDMLDFTGNVARHCTNIARISKEQ